MPHDDDGGEEVGRDQRDAIAREVPGEIIKLRIAIWDTSDHLLDSIAAIDAFT